MFFFYANGHNLTLGEGMNMLPSRPAIPHPTRSSRQAAPISHLRCLATRLRPADDYRKSGQYTQINPGGFGLIQGAKLYLHGGVTVGM